MKFGMCLPYMERDFTRERILNWCQMLDSGPFHSISCGERITGYAHEMRVLLAAAAAITNQVRIVPSLYVLPMHSAVWAAKEIATLDALSGGRVTVTVGVGSRPNDYLAVGANFDGRHQRLAEQVSEMRRIWRGEPPFEGADEVGPRPVQADGPPLLIGAMGPKNIERASHWAHGIYAFSMGGKSDEIKRLFSLTDEAWERAGRKEAPYKMAGFWFSLAPDAQAKLEEYVFGYLRYFGDTPARAVAKTMRCSNEDTIRQAIDDIEKLGCDELMLVPATSEECEIERITRLIVTR